MSEVKEKHVNITGSSIKEYVNRFDSPLDMFKAAKDEAEAYTKDVSTLVVSMSDLYKANVIPLALLDVTVEINVSVMGETIIHSRVGTPGFAKELSDQLLKDKAEAEKVEG